MNTWVLIAIVFFFCVFIVCALVEIASIFSLDEEYMEEYRMHTNQGRSKTTSQTKQRGEKS